MTVSRWLPHGSMRLDGVNGCHWAAVDEEAVTGEHVGEDPFRSGMALSLIHISEPTRP